MSSILTFYVRIILPDIQAKIISPLRSLGQSIGEYLQALIKDCDQDDQEEELARELRKLLNGKVRLLCWKHPCSVKDVFEDLFSKVETIDDAEADVFELEAG